MRTRVALLLSAVVWSMVACNAISGVDDLGFRPAAPGGAAGGLPVGGGDGSGAGGATSAGGNGGDAGVEDCTNGLDDDRDGDVDCYDDACTDHHCVPTVADDAVLLVAARPPDGCPSPLVETELLGCPGCSCVTTEGTCRIDTHSFEDESCLQLVDTYTETEACQTLPAPEQQHLQVVVSPQTGGACAPRATAVPSTPQLFCAARSLGSCPDGLVCAPPSLPPETTCALVPIGSRCPSHLPDERPVFPDESSQCICDCAASQSCTGGTVSYFLGPGCTGSPLVVPPGQACTDVDVFSVSAEIPTSETACAPQAGFEGARSKLCCPPARRGP